MAKVSVCVPSFQYHKIVETLDSVLAQTFTDFELLIEDDGSQDETPSIVQRWVDEKQDARVHLVLKPENEGQNKTTNNLVKRATGEYMCLLPCDDVWPADKLAKQVAYLDATPECGIVFGHPRFMDDRGAPLTYPQSGIEDIGNDSRLHWRARFQSGNCLFIATSMYRRSLHETLGYFSEELRILADLEWYIRVVKDNDLYIIQEPMAKIRLRDDQSNLSSQKPETVERQCDEMDLIRDRHWPVDPEKTKYLFATPFYEVKGYANYIKSMFQTVYALARHTKVDFEFNELSGDSYVWRARNLLAESFLHSNATHLIFIDSDQGWSLESIMRLLKAEGDVVGGAYPTKNDWERYPVSVYTNEDGTPKVNEQGLISAAKIPTGFMKIKRSVFERIKKAQPHNWYWEGVGSDGGPRKMFNYFGHLTLNHYAMGEDVSFCKRCEMLGIEMWIEPRCDISHAGSKVWEGNYHKFLMKQPGGSQDPALKAA